MVILSDLRKKENRMKTARSSAAKPPQILYKKEDVLLIIHNQMIFHPKNMGNYWSKSKGKKLTVEFICR